MTRLVGYGRNKGEVYPGGGAGGGSPIAAMPFAQLGLSDNVDYTPGGGAMLIPFDTVVYESTAFGDFEAAAGVGTVFTVPFGAYLAVLQMTTVDNDISFGASVALATATGQDAGGNVTTASIVSVSASAMRLGTETPFPGTVRPVIVVPTFLPPEAGDPGQISASTTKLFIWRIQGFVAAPAP